jgi:hypothetical protein
VRVIDTPRGIAQGTKVKNYEPPKRKSRNPSTVAPSDRIRGKVEFDDLERVSSQILLDMLEVPQRSRTAGTYCA